VKVISKHEIKEKKREAQEISNLEHRIKENLEKPHRGQSEKEAHEELNHEENKAKISVQE